MRFPRTRGSTSVMVRVFIPDNTVTTGAGVTGLTSASTNLAIAYSRALQNGFTQITGANLVTITTIGTWASPGTGKLGFKAVDATNAPGLYEVHFPDDAAAFGTGDLSDALYMNILELTTTALKIGPNMVLIPLTPLNYQDGVRMGMTALPNAAPAAVGGLLTGPTTANTGLADVTRWLGTAVSTPAVAGVPNVNTKTWNDLATVSLPLVPTTAGRTLDVSAGGEAGVDWANVGSPTTALALIGTTIATTQKVDVETIKTNPVVNAGTITFPTTATLASTTNLTAGTITTVTNLTNLPTIPANWLTAAGTAADFSAEVADQVWDEVLSGHLTAGTTGGRIGRIPDIAAGAAGGLFVAGSNAATTVNITGTISAVTTLTTLPTIPANWLTAAGTAADFTVEIQAGLATAAALVTVADYLDTEMAAALAAIIAVKAVTDLIPNAGALTNLDAAVSTRATQAQILTTALTESYAALHAVPTLTQAIMEIRALLAEVSAIGTVLTAKQIDGVSVAETFALDSATSPTSVTRAT